MATETVSLMGMYLFPKGEVNMDSSDWPRPSHEYYTLTDASQGRLWHYSLLNSSKGGRSYTYGQNYAFCMYICTRI